MAGRGRCGRAQEHTPCCPLTRACLPPSSEFEARLAASERKVYALTKERDALRRGSEKLSGLDDLLREKDSIITQARACSARGV